MFIFTGEASSFGATGGAALEAADGTASDMNTDSKSMIPTKDSWIWTKKSSLGVTSDRESLS